MSAPAVRERLKALEKRGVLQGYWCYPDPSVFGREDLMVFYNGDWQREDVLRALSAPDVAFVTWKLDRSLSIQTWPIDRLKPVKDLETRLGVKPSGTAFAEPTQQRKLSSVDWQIIDVLIDDPTIPLNELIEKTGLSPKTVRNHLTQMIFEKAIFVMPRLGALADTGELVYHLAVTGRVSMSELRKNLGDCYLISEAQEPPMKYLLCRATDLADVTSKTHAVRNHPEVSSVNLTLNKELVPGNRFIHALIKERISRIRKATA